MSKMLHLRRLIVLGAAAAFLSGCFLNPDALPPNDTRSLDQLYHSAMRLQPSIVEPQIETVTMFHSAKFSFGEDTLSEAETERLVKFLQKSDANRKARIEIDGPRKAAGKHDILTAARIAAIADRLSTLGISAQISSRPIESLAKPEDAIVVSVTRAMIIEPDCDVPKTIYGPRPTHIWSCSNATALGRMVADPLDLERGRALAPGDGETLAAGIKRYREDEIKELDEEETSSQ